MLFFRRLQKLGQRQQRRASDTNENQNSANRQHRRKSITGKRRRRRIRQNNQICHLNPKKHLWKIEPMVKNKTTTAFPDRPTKNYRCFKIFKQKTPRRSPNKLQLINSRPKLRFNAESGFRPNSSPKARNFGRRNVKRNSLRAERFYSTAVSQRKIYAHQRHRLFCAGTCSSCSSNISSYRLQFSIKRRKINA